jgi:allantoate deiminase
MTNAARLQKRIDDLARIGGSGTSVSRLGLTMLEDQARELVASWCDHGATAIRDAARNLRVRYAAEHLGEPAVLVGSHLDSVPEGGRFDGALGVCCAVEAVESLRESGVRFARPVEIVGWADEEGARFGIGLFGSAAAFGRLPADALDRKDKSGVSVREALRAIKGLGDLDTRRAFLDPAKFRAYLELHIEQGPRLERAGRALGVVSDIVGIYHGRVTVRGRQDHAGATVMGERKDALVAASHLIQALELIAALFPDTVGTVGEIAVRPGAKNVVPGECTFSLDIRAPKQASIDHVLEALNDAVDDVTGRRGVEVSIDTLQTVAVTPLDPEIRALLLRATKEVGIDAPLLVSGAGHDAQNPSLSGVPTGMIFVRSTGGSHNPNELADIDDAALGARALELAIRELATT